MYNSQILKILDNFDLGEINQGIDELEKNIDKTYIGKRFKEKLALLYILRSHAENKNICGEIHDLKEQIFKEWLRITDIRDARVRTFNTWGKYQNQSKGAVFVRDGLKYELEKLQIMEVVSK
ncbi:hypothetical protein [Enterococcus faecalis]|uniref:hypothetical protein n=1 Tax=Enterococcus faecalis TaxID=1351 RepID=UPI003D0BFCFA